MGKGHLSKEELLERQLFDEEVQHLAERGYDKKEIAEFLKVSVNKVVFSLHRLEYGYSMNKLPHSAEDEAKEEAEMLIAAKMAPIVKPKAKLTRVDGWENGKYVHYTATDVSEFWGL